MAQLQMAGINEYTRTDRDRGQLSVVQEMKKEVRYHGLKVSLIIIICNDNKLCGNNKLKPTTQRMTSNSPLSIL